MDSLKQAGREEQPFLHIGCIKECSKVAEGRVVATWTTLPGEDKTVFTVICLHKQVQL